ncbi:hypothetical protein AQPE_1745 [Aquipluma nitroreducens]|uniref:Uncharacterized protein n=1 Tax=Aquipluma nitroreducens TaxID=2010828 RepID=A0A5K7S814_9BACT|nr:hypothetical protein [Aquipluma nitroreducens]BBE17589.1 hypothetical protein AQPE_1745 [Aquipluma nitroreducens]
MELVDLIIGGTGVVKGLLLLLGLGYDEKIMKEEIKRYYEDFMKMKSTPADNKVDELIAFVVDDNFKPGTHQRGQNWGYLFALKNLKESIVKFYFTSLEEIQKGKGEFTDVRDVYLRISEYMLQLMRLRIVIDPDYKLSRNKHPQTGITYLAIKAYWIDDEGKKVRKFTKSIGREDHYKDGIDDKKAAEDGLKLIQPVLYDYYKEIYPD